MLNWIEAANNMVERNTIRNFVGMKFWILRSGPSPQIVEGQSQYHISASQLTFGGTILTIIFTTYTKNQNKNLKYIFLFSFNNQEISKY